MDQKTKNKFGAAFRQWVEDPQFEVKFDEELKEFSLSELLLAIMEEDQKSVRKLADLAVYLQVQCRT